MFNGIGFISNSPQTKSHLEKNLYFSILKQITMAQPAKPSTFLIVSLGSFINFSYTYSESYTQRWVVQKQLELDYVDIDYTRQLFLKISR